MTFTPDSDAGTNAEADPANLCRQVREGSRTIVIVALIFLAVAFAWTSIRGPVYEATAFAEVNASADLATIEQKLRFPSLYEKVAGPGESAVDLAQRSRVKNPRNSRLIAVAVRDADPARAATSADAIIEGFIGFDRNDESASELRARIRAIEELSDDSSPVSPAALLDALNTHNDNVKKSAEQGDKAAQELALKKQQLLESRIEEFVKTRRPQLGLSPLPSRGGFDTESALETTIADLDELYAKRGELDARARRLEAGAGSGESTASVRLVERATPTAQPVSPGRLVICLGAVVLGAFSGVLLVLFRSS